jgi:hypothetical protein
MAKKQAPRSLTSHLFDYCVLAAGAVVILLAFFMSWPDQMFQAVWAITFGIFYVGWGFWHHVRSDSADWPVVTEYLALGILITSILLITLGY